MFMQNIGDRGSKNSQLHNAHESAAVRTHWLNFDSRPTIESLLFQPILFCIWAKNIFYTQRSSVRLTKKTVRKGIVDLKELFLVCVESRVYARAFYISIASEERIELSLFCCVQKSITR